MKDRYQKQMFLPEFGIEGQKKLSQARVLVIGCGGLGCSVLPLLIAAGVGFLRIYDPDYVEESNLHRQYMYSMADLGQAKALVMQKILKEQNPECKIEAHVQKLSYSYLSNAVRDIDLVIDAADNFIVTYLLSDYCYEAKIPFISASVLEYHGYVGAFCGGKPSYRAVFPKPVFSNMNCNTVGVMGPVVAILGSLQAQMTLNIILNLSKPTLGQLFYIDCFNWKTSQFSFDKAEEPDFKDRIDLLDVKSLKKDDYLVELRDFIEKPNKIRSDVIRIKSEKILDVNFPSDRRIVLICKTGMRAIKSAYQLKIKGYKNLGILSD